MAEDDGVRDLHHRRLDVQEKDAGFARVFELLLVELAQRLLAHVHRIDDLAVQQRDLRLEDGGLATLPTSSMRTSRALSSVMDFSP